MILKEAVFCILTSPPQKDDPVQSLTTNTTLSYISSTNNINYIKLVFNFFFY